MDYALYIKRLVRVGSLYVIVVKLADLWFNAFMTRRGMPEQPKLAKQWKHLLAKYNLASEYISAIGSARHTCLCKFLDIYLLP